MPTYKTEGTIYWAQVQKPSKFGHYEVDLIMDEDAAKEVTRLIKEAAESKKDRLPKVKKDERGYFMRFRKAAFNPDGDPLPKPIVRDKNNKDFDGLIGNGSKGVVAWSTYHYSNQFGVGVKVNLVGIKVNELVEYQTDPFADEEVVEEDSAQTEDTLEDDDLPF